MEEFIKYVDFFLAIGVILLWVTLVAMIIIMWIGSKIESKKFFMVAKKSLKFTGIDESIKGITNDFEVYRNHRFGFKSKTIIELCQELERKLKLNGELEYVDKLENIILVFKDEYRFDDEKMNELISHIQMNSGINEARQVKEYLIRINSFNAGIVFEKDRYLKDVLEKTKRRKWVSNIGYILGVVGSVVTIYQFLL